MFGVFACSDPEDLISDAGTIPQRDASLPDATVFPDASEPEPTFTFETTDPPSPALVFANATADATQLSVDITGRGLANIHGVAFRLSFDPAVLTFVSLEKRDAFPPSAGLERAAEGRPGLIVAAFGQLGTTSGVAIDGVAIARASFQRLSAAPTTLRLERGFALDARGLEIKIGVGSGELVRR